MNSVLEKIREVVGPHGLLTGDDVTARSDSWPPAGGCEAGAIIRPASTAEVASVLRLCNEAGQSAVTHGGLTGLVGGGKAGPQDLVLSLERMNGMDAVDRANRTVTVEAGVPLQKVQETAEESGLLFPLDLGARGSATIGGNVATNAGGNSVLRYGMMREQVLGLEAVLADGTVISSMNNVIKNNTGYDLKQLFIGSEGTLGIVTRAVLRLRAPARSRNTAIIAIEDFDKLSAFLASTDAALGGQMSAFEVMWNDFWTLITGEDSRHGQPLGNGHAFYVLLESTGCDQEVDQQRFEATLEEAFESELIVDALIAQSGQQRADMWAVRDDVDGLVKKLHPLKAFDVSMAIPVMAEYVEDVRTQLAGLSPPVQMVTFGHLGDGNIHLVMNGCGDPEMARAIEQVVYETLGRRRGVISAEHGIGLEKRPFLKCSRSAEEIALMRQMKTALDPRNILNPGKILEP